MPTTLTDPVGHIPSTEMVQSHDFVTLRDFLLAVMNERDRKYEQRFTAMEKTIWDTNQALKDAVDTSNTNTKEALAQAYAAIKDALAAATSNVQTMSFSIDKRFESVNEFRAQLTDQASTFARKGDVEGIILAMEKATLKAEQATEKRFDSVNEFRAQLSDQQRTLATKAEVDIRLDALDKKLDAAIESLQLQRGHAIGANAVWSALGVALALLVSIITLVIKLR